MENSSRLDSRLEAEGAEFLVLAHLLIEGIQAIKAYTRFPGYDLIAADPDNGTSCRIQVKSRWATDYDRAFPLRNLETDFVVLVALNRGFRYRRQGESGGKQAPELYVFPIDLLVPLVKTSGGWSKVHLRNVLDVDTYKDRWDLVKEYLTRGDEKGIARN
ncbi:hypothetical protein [Actinoplanes sp. NPDC026670]|uniref:hypothetical protein n=1 Tax=Actinoplanes sp. NPDC026670 TaxID=3154700 RepID=UPI0033CAD0BE